MRRDTGAAKVYLQMQTTISITHTTRYTNTYENFCGIYTLAVGSATFYYEYNENNTPSITYYNQMLNMHIGLLYCVILQKEKKYSTTVCLFKLISGFEYYLFNGVKSI